MSTWPSSLGLAFEDKVRALQAVIQPDQKERKLRQGVDYHSAVLPDVRTFDITGDSTRRLSLSAAAITAIRGWAHGDAKAALFKVEHTVDQNPPRYWDRDWYDIYPKQGLPQSLVIMGPTPSTGETVRLHIKANHNYQLPAPAAPTLTLTGTGNAQTLTYVIVARDSAGTTVGSTATSTTTGPTTPNGTNYITPSWLAVPYADSYDVYRTVSTSPATQGLIGNTTSLSLDDTALAGDSSSVPVVNTTETSIGPPARSFVAALAGSFAAEDICAANRDNRPDFFGGAPSDDEAIYARAVDMKARLFKEWSDWVNKVVGDPATTKPGMSFGRYKATSRHPQPLFDQYRDRSTGGAL